MKRQSHTWFEKTKEINFTFIKIGNGEKKKKKSSLRNQPKKKL